jgi:hypothetical protein
MTRSFALFLLLLAAVPASALDVTWHNKLDLYADDVESFTPWRIDGTILSNQYKTWLDFNVTPQSFVQLGFLFMYESGSGNFNTNTAFPIPKGPITSSSTWATNQSADAVMPVISWRWRTDSSLASLGTIETVNRHGFIEPIQRVQLDITRPIEYGGQWIEKRDRWRLDAFLSWSRLQINPTQREQFVAGFVGEQDLLPWFALEQQIENFHQGGQGLDSAVAGFVSNNSNFAGGGSFHGNLGWLHDSSLTIWGLASNDTFFITGGQGGKQGSALYVQATAQPGNWFELFGSEFRGRDYITMDGDPNYNSQYQANTFATSTSSGFPLGYLGRRTVHELGFRKTVELNKWVTFDAEERNQWVQQYFVWMFRVVGRLRFDRLLWSWAD